MKKVLSVLLMLTLLLSTLTLSSCSSDKTDLEYIKDKGNIFKYWDTMANFVSVYEGEIVSVIDNSCEGYTYIRTSKGELGWIPKEAVILSESHINEFKL